MRYNLEADRELPGDRGLGVGGGLDGETGLQLYHLGLGLVQTQHDQHAALQVAEPPLPGGSEAGAHLQISPLVEAVQLEHVRVHDTAYLPYPLRHLGVGGGCEGVDRRF